MSEPVYQLEDEFGRLPVPEIKNSSTAAKEAKSRARAWDRTITIVKDDGTIWDVYPDGAIQKRYRSRES